MALWWRAHLGLAQDLTLLSTYVRQLITISKSSSRDPMTSFVFSGHIPMHTYIHITRIEEDNLRDLWLSHVRTCTQAHRGNRSPRLSLATQWVWGQRELLSQEENWFRYESWSHSNSLYVTNPGQEVTLWMPEEISVSICEIWQIMQITAVSSLQRQLHNATS